MSSTTNPTELAPPAEQNESAQNPPSLPSSALEPTSKKRASEANINREEGSLKRQRIEGGEAQSSLSKEELETIKKEIREATKRVIAKVKDPSFMAKELDHPYPKDPQTYMRWNSLPMLENLCSQTLSLLLYDSFAQTMRTVVEPTTDKGNNYQALKNLFNQVRPIYESVDRTDPKSDFIRMVQGCPDPEECKRILSLANLTILLSSTLEGEGYWKSIHQQYPSVLLAPDEDLNREVGELYLNFSTQMMYAALSNAEEKLHKEKYFTWFFSKYESEHLCARHPNQGLTQMESELVQSMAERREKLENLADDAESLAKFMEAYPWIKYLEELFNYVKRRFGPLIPEYKMASLPHLDLGNDPPQIIPSVIAGAQTVSGNSVIMGPDTQGAIESSKDPTESDGGLQKDLPISGESTATTQSKPTAVLYEEARQQAALKNSSGARRTDVAATARRPWTTEEERALMAGLDQMQGSNWSAILNLYGKDGTISNVLAGRNQVQLKDKARNLKLFFLKSGIEVPYYLSSVTGELKTRAPSQAAKNEAEGQLRVSSEEEVSRPSSVTVPTNGAQTTNTGFASGISSNPGIVSDETSSRPKTSKANATAVVMEAGTG